jgi:hypothetical protein
MTWLDRLRGGKLINNIFLLMQGDGTQNDRMLRTLERLTSDRASINDLFQRQEYPRELIIAVLEARIQRRLS